MAIFYTMGKKVRKQMAKRGWTVKRIEETLNHPARIIQTRDIRYDSSKKQVDEPATAYIRSDGHYVVRNDRTGDIVQISDCHDQDWQMPF